MAVTAKWYGLGLAGCFGGTAAAGTAVDYLSDTIKVSLHLDYKLASRQTISSERGYVWEDEDELMQQEQASGDNVGAQILRAFNQGQ